MNHKKILFFGGSGSLGNKFIERNIKNNYIYNYSRDECKHWQLEMKFKKYINNLKNIIGDIRDKKRVKENIKEIDPDYIIIASALKHIERCEYSSYESINTNIIGVQNILDSIDEIKCNCANIVFISTDKACSPVNLYGMCKSVSEKLILEKAKKNKIKNRKYNIVRYGNVLNSRGSIIPLLHKMGKNEDTKYFTLTDNRMTRFIMTLEESCELIEYTIKNGENGETIIPSIRSMKIKDLFEIFSNIYKKEIKITGLRPGEKLYESLINGTQYLQTYKKHNYYHIMPCYINKLINTEQKDINSNFNIINMEDLKKLLINLQLIG